VSPSSAARALAARGMKTGRVLDLGTGPGTQAYALAQLGFDVTASDLSEHAVELGREGSRARGLPITFVQDDILDTQLEGAFDVVFDRGCFHVFDDESERARFARNVSLELAEHGLWLSLIGSTEGPPRDVGPPRLSAREVVNAIEPSLEILQFRSGQFNVCGEPLKAWLCLSGKRTTASSARR